MSQDARWLGGEWLHLALCDSTNDVAAAWARGVLADRGPAPHGAVVVADAQRRGRGRQGRTWHSPSGESLYLSVVLRPPLEPRRVPPLVLAAAVGLSDALSVAGVTPELKWPNDVLLGGRKVAGILTEMVCTSAAVDFVVLGVGVNLNNPSFPPEIADIAISLSQVLGRHVEPEAFARDLCHHLEEWYERFVASGAGPVVAAWKARSHMLGRPVEVRSGADVVRGVAENIDDDGLLHVRTASGEQVRVVAGDVVI